MTRFSTLLVGIVGGMLLAGIAVPALVLVLPPRWRPEPLILTVAALIVGAVTYGVWLKSERR
jgi:hypothetical protein